MVITVAPYLKHVDTRPHACPAQTYRARTSIEASIAVALSTTPPTSSTTPPGGAHVTSHREHAPTQEGRTVRAGVATFDITPAGPVAMSGFIARTDPSSGVHDQLSVRALVVDRTALVTVDVVGLHEDLCARVRAAVQPWVDHAVIHATHTHSGPVSMPGRLGTEADREWLARVEADCVAAVRSAAESREPANIAAGYGADPNIGHNRRRSDGPVDHALPVIRLERPNGTTMALLVSYACHPVVLSARNTLLSADYPGVVRRRLEGATGATALFATSCAGDINTGHALDGRPEDPHRRTFARCEDIGRCIADAALRSTPSSAPQTIGAAHGSLEVPLMRLPTDELARSTARQADAVPTSWTARISVLHWGPAVIVALPGEPFTQASLEIRRRISSLTDADVVAILGYSDGCPGYFPSCDEYSLGGYEIEEAHRYYGMPGPFAQGSLEQLIQTAVQLVGSLRTADRLT